MTIPEQRVEELLASIAAKTPTPGGGAVAALTAATAAALTQMVVNFSIGRKALAEYADLLQKAATDLEDLRRQALQLAEADAAAYHRLNELWKLDPEDERRQREWRDAVDAAIDAPQQVMALCETLLAQVSALVGKSNRMLRSDLAIAAEMAEAASRAAAWNVRVNLPLIEDQAGAADIERRMSRCLDDARIACETVERGCLDDA